MKIKRIPIIGIVGIVIGALLSFHTNNPLLTIVAFWAIAELVGILLAPRLPEKWGYLINSSHWVHFNLKGRLFGIWAIIIGLGFAGKTLYLTLFPDKNYILTIEIQITNYVIAVLLFALGIAFLTVKGYYPKEYNTTRTKEDEMNK